MGITKLVTHYDGQYVSSASPTLRTLPALAMGPACMPVAPYRVIFARPGRVAFRVPPRQALCRASAIRRSNSSVPSRFSDST
jgi:hypothetical protein